VKPLCIDLFCGLGGWAEGFLAEGYDVIGFDIERRPYPGQLVLQDVRTLHGAQFRNAAMIVASPPCQEYSYRAMPWKRAKALPPPSNELFDACFRIQREAGNVPMVVENVCGAQRWVGRAKWHFGSYYLWGDVPALMPTNMPRRKAAGTAAIDWSKYGEPGYKAVSFNFENEKAYRAIKALDPDYGTRGWFGPYGGTNLQRDSNGDYGLKFGGGWWHDATNNLIRKASSRSEARRAASAMIAKIPFDLAQYIARVYKPEVFSNAAD
jgi:hypothetical protein